MEKSDPYYYIVSGAGSKEIDGKYVRDGDAIRNGSRVYKMTKDGEVRRDNQTRAPTRNRGRLSCVQPELRRGRGTPSSEPKPEHRDPHTLAKGGAVRTRRAAGERRRVHLRS